MDMDDMDGQNIVESNDNQQQEAVDIDDIDNKGGDNSNNIFAGGKYFVSNEPEDTCHKVRSYDLSITYDFYYQTPRLWLLGYNEEGQLLKEEEVF